MIYSASVLYCNIRRVIVKIYSTRWNSWDRTKKADQILLFNFVNIHRSHPTDFYSWKLICRSIYMLSIQVQNMEILTSNLLPRGRPYLLKIRFFPSFSSHQKPIFHPLSTEDMPRLFTFIPPYICFFVCPPFPGPCWPFVWEGDWDIPRILTRGVWSDIHVIHIWQQVVHSNITSPPSLLSLRLLRVSLSVQALEGAYCAFRTRIFIW